MTFDVVTMGRISVDVYPQQVGVSLREVTSFGKFLGAREVATRPHLHRKIVQRRDIRGIDLEQ